MAQLALQMSSLGVEGEGIWLALGTIGMLLGMLYFIADGLDVQDPRQKEFYVITILIPAIAAASYLSMFFGFGLTEVSLANGRVVDVYWARYADWLFTTPLLLLDIGLLAGASQRDIGALVGIDAFMIVTGLVATLTKVVVARYAFWTISTISMVFLLYYLVAVFGEAVSDADEDTRSTFNALRNIILVTWAIYPVAWLVGTEGLALTGLYGETLLFMVLDLVAKVGFGFILLRSRAIMGGGSEPTPSAQETAADLEHHHHHH
uniref:Bacteriorhodopsin-I n=1 Tax=Haloquadratum walsbyi (strain DSM 16790 / HBSQ001) TaxID=362976 RepID=UPI000673052C|nr:Chain A, Bacteriorhodopsin-I [Haloquadratum walsbyi DSM 16790]4QI1_B Chain B, Bacteriorhodopsin-I [Haloquadratum walsbyi DSM 16790]4QI1_C Chain C, Bacteriorhodopsin-I [Haloquadratum walsbyi DSM 16790]4QID_A Chain A, Bacteriorhodopsin-I [Haloquadratum walsbyi DSM 16790]4QID_B Chain B, Bacteriorhodopsin-I [Haloquadratum walsbyi DSM 16790]